LTINFLLSYSAFWSLKFDPNYFFSSCHLILWLILALLTSWRTQILMFFQILGSSLNFCSTNIHGTTIFVFYFQLRDSQKFRKILWLWKSIFDIYLRRPFSLIVCRITRENCTSKSNNMVWSNGSNLWLLSIAKHQF